jgi:hypothetical protein
MSSVGYMIIEGDLEPDMGLILSIDDAPASLVGATAIIMRWKKPDGTVSQVALANVDLLNGQVKRVWTAGDTDIVGYHEGQVRVTRANGEYQTFPSNGGSYVWLVSPKLIDSDGDSGDPEV